MTQAEIDAAIPVLAMLHAQHEAWARYRHADVLATALACLRDYVPREDRERAISMAYTAGRAVDDPRQQTPWKAMAEARRWLKLEPQPPQPCDAERIDRALQLLDATHWECRVCRGSWMRLVHRPKYAPICSCGAEMSELQP